MIRLTIAFHGGGVLLAVNRKFKSTLLENVSLTESVFLEVESKTAKFIIAVVYFPPDPSPTDYRRFLTAFEDIAWWRLQLASCLLVLTTSSSTN